MLLESISLVVSLLRRNPPKLEMEKNSKANAIFLVLKFKIFFLEIINTSIMHKHTNTTTPDLDPEWGIDIITATILKRYIKVEILICLTKWYFEIFLTHKAIRQDNMRIA
jgi:hypothetical protein